MAPRRLLIVTYHFPPSSASGSFRMLGFARHLPQYGWRPIVVAPPLLPWEPVDWDLCGRIPDDVTVNYVRYPDGLLTWPIRKFAYDAAWLPWALGACRRAVLAYRPDAVLTSGPPHWVHALGLHLRRGHALPWVADFRDPWVAGNWFSAWWDIGRGWRAQLAARIERAVAAAADAVIANAPLAGEAFRAAYPAHDSKVRLITNGYDRETFEDPLPRPPTHDAIEIIHTGSIYPGRDLRPFLDAVRDLRCKGSLLGRPLWVGFFGSYSGPYDLGGEIRRRNLDGMVRILGQVPYTEALRTMRKADILLLIDHPHRRLGVPAKLYEYIGACRPVLALGEHGGDLEWALHESGVVHRIANPSSSAEIKRALVALVDEASTGRGTPPDDRRLKFTREQLAGDLARLLDQIYGRGGPTGCGSAPRLSE